MKARNLASAVTISAVLGAGLVAQGQQTPPVKTPRPHPVTTMEKLPAPVEAKTEGTVQWPLPANRNDQNDPPRPLGTREKGVVNALAKTLQSNEDVNTVLLDQPPTDGTIWVRGNNYKASFNQSGWSFINRSQAGATTTQPIHFHLAGAQVAGQALNVADAAPTRSDRHVEYGHGDVIEAIDVTGTGVEQTFTFAKLPARGELVVDLGVATTLTGETTKDGIVFTSPFDHVRYAPAVAIDARGNRTAAVTELAEGHLTIRVPASFVAEAQLPLVIDPWVGSNVVHSDATNDLGNPDVAWDESSQTWAVCYQRHFSGSDTDCYVQRLDAGLNLVGGPITIDFTSNSWTRPRIACNRGAGIFMVVAQVSAYPAYGYFKVSAVQMTNAGVTTSQFDIYDSGGVNDFRPDVAGDPDNSYTYFTVVWEHAYSPSDHDIYARQVDYSTNLQAMIYIQTNTNYQSHPSISKSDGAAPGASYQDQRFVIVYQETYPPNPADEDIWGSMLTWDGLFVPVGGNNQFHVDFTGSLDVWPVVSSPALADGGGNRFWLAAYQDVNANNGDIVATCMDINGTFFARDNITALETSGSRLSWTQELPSVDTDGVRFAVCYDDNWQAGTDLDTRATLVAMVNGSLQVEEAGTWLSGSGNPEFNVQVASTYSGNGYYSGNRYCTVNDRDDLSGSFAIDAVLYDGYYPYGGFSSRATGCGGLTTNVSGSAIIGQSFTVTVGSAYYLTGVVMGTPIPAVTIPACPSCTLGVNGFGYLGNPIPLTIPVNTSLVTATVSFQGFTFQSGPCLGSISLSNTIDVTIQ